MENYYEAKDVSQSTEIRSAYEAAIKANAPKYRAVSKTNKYYGWDEKSNKFIKAQIGQEWFDNPYYVEPVKEEPIEESIEEIEPVVEPEPAIDYKALYDEKCAEIETLKTEYEQVKQYAESIKTENTELKHGLSAFKALMNRI